MIAVAKPDSPTRLLTPEDIVRDVRHLPSAPKVLPRLKQLLCDGNSAMEEIVALIRLDAGIAVRVLQVSNSAYFSKGVLCLSVEDAVNRVGYDQVYELISCAVASQVLIRPLAAYRIEADELWRMSVAGALAAEALAGSTNQDRDAAYTLGLLHCVGMVAVDEWALRSMRSLQLTMTAFPREATESERRLLGVTQAEVGRALLREWEFPPSISEPVRWQYAPLAAGGHTRMATLLYAAKWVRDAVCGRRPPPPEASYLQYLAVKPATLAALAEGVMVRLADLSSPLEQSVPGGDKAGERQRFPNQAWPA